MQQVNGAILRLKKLGSRIYACYTLLKLIMCLNDCPEIKTLSAYLDRMQKIEKLSHVRKSLEHWKTKSSVTCSQLWQSASSPFIYDIQFPCEPFRGKKETRGKRKKCIFRTINIFFINKSFTDTQHWCCGFYGRKNLWLYPSHRSIFFVTLALGAICIRLEAAYCTGCWGKNLNDEYCPYFTRIAPGKKEKNW